MNRIKELAKGRGGFTLIELLVVMAIIGVLAGVVTLAVSGTGETSSVAQARADGSTIQNAASTFFTDNQAGTEVLSPRTVLVTAKIGGSIVLTEGGSLALGTVTYDAGSSESAFTQKKSSRWPEVFLTENLNDSATASACVDSVYCEEFPTAGLNSNGVVIRVVLADSDGAAIGRSTLLAGYTAVDFATLTAEGYQESAPVSVDQTSEIDVGTVTVTVHNFLWLFRKSTSAGGTAENDARGVAVFKLASAEVTEVTGGNDTVTLSYAQIF